MPLFCNKASPVSANKPIRCKAAILEEYNQPLKIEEVEVAPPLEGEVRVKILATGLCHSDLFAIRGGLPSFQCPIVLGHEAYGVVESVGLNVREFKPGDFVIPLLLPQCRKCSWCKSPLTNQCQVLGKVALGKQLDGTSRMTWNGKPLNAMFTLGTFSEYSVIPEVSLAKVRSVPKPSEACVLGCAIPTGYGSAVKTARVERGTTAAVWGLGGVGLAAILGCRDQGAARIFGIDINADKFDLARSLGATDLINPRELEGPLPDKLIEETGGGLDYAIVSVGNVDAIKQAFSSCHPSWGSTVVVGLTPAGSMVELEAMEFVNGKKIMGSFMGGWRLKDDIPKLVDLYLQGKIPLDKLVSHTFSLDNINEGLDMLRKGQVIRAVVTMD